MDRGIKEGDIVTAYWTGGGLQMTGRVRNIPQNTGDLWYIETADGTISAINPCCSDLISIDKKPEKKGGLKMDKDKMLTREELVTKKASIKEQEKAGLWSRRSAERLYVVINTALSLYAEKEALEKRIDGLIEKMKKELCEIKDKDTCFNSEEDFRRGREYQIGEDISDLEGLKEGGNAIK
jgi:hypothetical protein